MTLHAEMDEFISTTMNFNEVPLDAFCLWISLVDMYYTVYAQYTNAVNVRYGVIL